LGLEPEENKFIMGFEMQHRNMQSFCLNSPVLESSLCVSKFAVPKESGSPSFLSTLGFDGDPQFGEAAQIPTTFCVIFWNCPVAVGSNLHHHGAEL